MSRIILFFDLILVVLVVIYFPNILKREKTPQTIEKKFEFGGLKLTSSCKQTIGCHVKVDSYRKDTLTKKILWNVTTAIDKDSKNIYTATSQPQAIKQNLFLEETFRFPLDSGQVVHLVLIAVDQTKEENRFQIFP